MLLFINSIHLFFILKGINFPEYTQMSLFITLFFSFQEWMSPSLVFQMDLQGKRPSEAFSHLREILTVVMVNWDKEHIMKKSP